MITNNKELTSPTVLFVFYMSCIVFILSLLKYFLLFCLIDISRVLFFFLLHFLFHTFIGIFLVVTKRITIDILNL